MQENLSLLEAYKAMLIFLDDYYFRLGQDDLGSVLGSIQLLSDSKTADPAAWNDWLDAVRKVGKSEMEQD